MQPFNQKKLLYLRPDEIFPDRQPPRQSVDEYELNSLAVSIAASGIIQPLVLRRGLDGSYTLISGHRRLAAAKIAGLRRVPCILQRTDNADADICAVTENIQRTQLHFFEEAAAIDRIIKTHGISKTEAAARLGLALPTLSNKLRLLLLSEKLQHRITAAGLSAGHAKALLRLPEYERDRALDRIIAEGLNIRQTEALIDSILYPEAEIPEQVNLQEKFAFDDTEREKPVRKSSIGDIKLFSNSLSKLITTMQSAGIETQSRKYETDKYIEYKVRIQKAAPDKYQQLKIAEVEHI